ncbi:phage tail tape measure protein [Mammaliicoccus sciuri]|uniref:phage tail tape measure protein n=1 Tax=Mammaliicoccus sciuri TaxID=1296 RepID=UPI002DB6DF89|nr:phage tail tape measure protein [Mammaliicoccus sciuri]MEB8131557.1 phage tail tape measure protein [Mammaliicoccus sciuri]
MAERIRGLQIDIGLNDMGIDRKLSEIKRSFRTLNTDLKLSRNNFVNSEKSMTSYKNRVRELDGALSVSKKNLEALRKQYQEVAKEQGHNSKTAQSLRQEINRQADTQNYLQKELGQTTEDFKAFQKEAREAQRLSSSGWGKVSKTFESMGPKLTSAGDAMKGVGRNMSMYVTAPIVGGFGLAVKTAADFEGQMSRVGAIAESSKGELKAMSDQAIDLGAKTSKSAAEVAQGMEELAALGFNAKEIMAAMPSVISASEASGADMAETATIMASSLNAFGLEAKDSGHVADLLAMAANKSAADISYMGDALKYAGPPANSLGVSLEDTSAAIGIMSDAGLEGSQAGTALRASFIRLAKPTKQSQKAMDAMGISLTNSKGEFVGMPKLIEQFKSGMQGMTKEQKLANVAQIVGTEAASGFLTLIDAGPSKIDKFSNSLKNSDGASKKAADRMKDNLKGSLEQLSGAFESAGIIIGNIFSPILRKLADTITWLVEKLNGMSKGMQITMVVLATLAAAIGPLIFAFGAFIAVIGSAMTTLLPLIVGIGKAGGIMAFLSGKLATAIKLFPMLGSAITLATGPVGWIAAAIVALGIAFVVAYKKSETFRNIVNSALNGVKQTFVTVGNIIKGFFQLFKGNGQDGVITLSKILPSNVVVGLTNFATKVKTIFFQVVTAVKNFAVSIGSQISAFWTKNGAEITQAVKTIGNVISTVFKFIWSYVIKPIMTLIWNLMKLLWPAIKMLVISVWNNIKGVIQGALNIILGIVKVFSALLTGNWKGVWQGIVQILRGAVKLAWNLVQLWFVGKILSVVKVGLVALRGVVVKGWTFIRNFIGKTAQAIWNSVRTKFTGMFKSVRGIFTNLSKFSRNLWTSLRNAITKFAQSIWTNVRTKFSGLFKSTRSIFTNLSKWTRNLWTALKNRITSLGQMIWTNIRNKFNGLYKSTRSIFTSLSKWSRNLWTNLKNAITKLAQNIWTNVRNKFTGMFKSVRGILGKLFNSSKNIFTNIKNSVTNLAHGARDNVVNGFKAMYNKGKSWISKLKNFLSSSVSGFKSVSKKVGNGVANGAINGLNKMIDGINSLSNKIMSKKLIKKKIPTLSTGTGIQTDRNGLLTRGTKAIVNDRGLGNGTGPNGHKELIYRRSGKVERPIGNNKKVTLRRGDGVLNGAQSQSLLPHLSTGTVMDRLFGSGAKSGKKKKKENKKWYEKAGENIGDAWDSTKDAGKKVADTTSKGVKSVMKGIGDVWDYASNPSKLINKVMGGLGINFDGIGGVMGNFIKWGAKKLKEGMVDLVTGWFEEESGGGDGSSFTKFGVTTPYSPNKAVPGYPTAFNGGRHYGIDYGTPSGTTIKAPTSGTVSKLHNQGGGLVAKLLSGKFTQFFMHLSEILKTGRVKQGENFAKTGNSGQWTTGAHLHYQVEKGNSADITNRNTMDPDKFLSGKGGGSKAASKWSPEIRKAAKRMKVTLTSRELQGIIAQIDRESSGNAGVTQGNIGDYNNLVGTPAQGLLQYVPSTFKAYAVKGHNNIKSGYDQLLAFFNNSNWRKDLPYGKSGWGPSGSRRFATGGLINSNGWYNLAEGGHPEFVIPTDPSKRTDAMKLLAIAANKIQGKPSNNKRPNQMRTPSNVATNHDAEILQMLAKQIEQQQEQINILTKIALSNQDIADKPVLSEREISKAQGKRSNYMAYNLGGAY